jgi:hypothetical protein
VLLVFSFLLRSPSSIWLAVFLFLEMAMYAIGGYCEPSIAIPYTSTDLKIPFSVLQHPPSV